jgi:hypothetical protein
VSTKGKGKRTHTEMAPDTKASITQRIKVLKTKRANIDNELNEEHTRLGHAEAQASGASNLPVPPKSTTSGVPAPKKARAPSPQEAFKRLVRLKNHGTPPASKYTGAFWKQYKDADFGNWFKGRGLSGAASRKVDYDVRLQEVVAEFQQKYPFYAKLFEPSLIAAGPELEYIEATYALEMVIATWCVRPLSQACLAEVERAFPCLHLELEKQNVFSRPSSDTAPARRRPKDAHLREVIAPALEARVPEAAALCRAYGADGADNNDGNEELMLTWRATYAKRIAGV